jgi:hypothetical protein
VSCYYRHAAWNGTPVLRECFDEARRKLRERSTMPDHSLLNDSDFHRLALLYVVLAYGTLMNTEGRLIILLHWCTAACRNVAWLPVASWCPIP